VGQCRFVGPPVDPSGRFHFLSDGAGDAVPLVIDRIGATLTAGPLA